MFPILPSTILLSEASRWEPAPDNEEADAQKHGRMVHPSRPQVSGTKNGAESVQKVSDPHLTGGGPPPSKEQTPKGALAVTGHALNVTT